LDETQDIAKEWLGVITTMYQPSDEAILVGLRGHLGSGKTAFAKSVAKILGVKDEVTSPTFVLMKIYETGDENWKRLVHIDAYRLEKREELEALDFESVISDKNNLVLIEWPENVELKDFRAMANLSFSIQNKNHLIDIK